MLRSGPLHTHPLEHKSRIASDDVLLRHRRLQTNSDNPETLGSAPQPPYPLDLASPDFADIETFTDAQDYVSANVLNVLVESANWNVYHEPDSPNRGVDPHFHSFETDSALRASPAMDPMAPVAGSTASSTSDSVYLNAVSDHRLSYAQSSVNHHAPSKSTGSLGANSAYSQSTQFVSPVVSNPRSSSSCDRTRVQQHHTRPVAADQFSFSQNQDLVLHVSPLSGHHFDHAPLGTNLHRSALNSSSGSLVSQKAHKQEPIPALPPKSETSSITSNPIGLILSNYDYSTSLLALVSPRLAEAKSNPLSDTAPLLNEKRKLADSAAATNKAQDHNRNDSLSSNISTTSTLTAKNSNQQRFVRYAMRTQEDGQTLTNTRWLMENVLLWLEMNGFNESWKETFRKNELSNTRFLELSNYEPNSLIWKQFSTRLEQNDNNSQVVRFINLLRSELEDSSTGATTPATLPDYDSPNKVEYRKSSSMLWAQTTPMSAPKPRPFSYIDPATIKSSKDLSHKFFRKHSRTSSNDSSKDQSLNSPVGTKQPDLTPSSSVSKKSSLFSTLRKYGGEKAAGIVKQVQSTQSSVKNLANRKSIASFTHSHNKKNQDAMPSRKNHPFDAAVSNNVEETESPHSVKSFFSSHFDDYSGCLEIESSKSASECASSPLIDQKYFPVSLECSDPSTKLLLLTKDGRSFISTSFSVDEMNDVSAFRKRALNNLEMLDIGTISFHLIDFNCDPGEAIPDDLLPLILKQDFFLKLKVSQDVQSLGGCSTLSSTSSGTYSFVSGDTSGQNYPATPQYMLQESKDKNVDYLSVKERRTDVRDEPIVIESNSAQKVRVPSQPMKLSMAHIKRAQLQNAGVSGIGSNRQPNLNEKIGFESRQDDTQTADKVSSATNDSKKSAETGSGSFSILRNNDKEIDFDIRRTSNAEIKAPRMIPNIYSSSLAQSQAPASNTQTETKDGIEGTTKSKSKTLSPALEVRDGTGFVARRKAPPPPTRNSSLKLKKKFSMSSLSHLPASNRSNDYSASTDSLDSFRSSQIHGSKYQQTPRWDPDAKFEFLDAPKYDFAFQGLKSDADDDADEFFARPILKQSSIYSVGSSIGKTQPQNPKINEGKGSKPDGKNSGGVNGVNGSGYFNDDDDDDDFFMKPMKNEKKAPQQKMNVRPPVEELYDNLEKYFPHSVLDKPIIDASPSSPCALDKTEPINIEPIKPSSRKISISRTFSNANKSPANARPDAEDDVFYGEAPGDSKLLRGRMKTIRAVANEARIKRLETKKGRGRMKVKTAEKIQPSLFRANTKLWGQKTVEVTPDQIERGFVGRIKNSNNGPLEEFAWVKGELIGRGSYGSVYLALNVTNGEMLAVKQVTLQPLAQSSSEGIEALIKEVQTMKDLDHLNIVQYLGFEQKQQTYSLFLEYVAGGSISSCLKSYGKFDEHLVRFITRQILEGLRYLHTNGILHRDLKADNLLLELDGTCKILDFGISKKSHDIYSNNAELSMQGTIFWMAPEVIHSMVEEKKQGYSAKVDIWSLGCVVLEMFAGQRPWSNEAVISAIYKIGKTKLAPPIPEDIGAEAKDFLDKCFTINSEERPTASELLQHEFMKSDPAFDFSKTRLNEMIKFNSRKSVAMQ